MAAFTSQSTNFMAVSHLNEIFSLKQNTSVAFIYKLHFLGKSCWITYASGATEF